MKLKRNRIEADVPTSSMADIAFLLIIFFMLTAVFSVTRGLDFGLPKDDPKDLIVKPEESIHVIIHGSGSYEVDRRPASLEEVGGYIQAKMEQNPKKPVIIQTDPNVPYGATIDVLDLCRQLEVRNISIPTQSDIKRWSAFLGQ